MGKLIDHLFILIDEVLPQFDQLQHEIQHNNHQLLAFDVQIFLTLVEQSLLEAHLVDGGAICILDQMREHVVEFGLDVDILFGFQHGDEPLFEFVLEEDLAGRAVVEDIV